jgi:hypothetical protein
MRTFAQIKNKSHLSILYSSYAVGVTFMLVLFGSVTLTNIAYGQIFPNTQDNTISATNSSGPSSTTQKQPTPSPPSTSLPTLHLVKIISPIKGQQVPVGDNLMISGTSADNTTSDCKVSVIVNGIKPYHDTFPNGQDGQSDYSKWNFALNPTYTGIKEGPNKITSKFSCGNDPSLISHNSVNVTGVAATDIPPTASNGNGSSQQQSQQQISSTATRPQIIAAGLNSTTVNSTATADSTTPVPSDATGVNDNGTTDNLKTLSVSLHLAKSSLHPGDKQTIAIKVADKNSTDAVGGASVSGRITSPSGLVKKLEGTTDDKGKTSYSWKVSDRYTTGKYKLKIEVSALGYENYSGSKTFKVTPIPVAVSNDNPISSSSISSPVHTTSSNDNIIRLPGPVNVPDSSLFTSDNTDSHHHHHHDPTPTIISSTPTDTIPNDNNIPSNSDNANTHTNTDTNTNNKGYNHHSTIIPSTAHNTDNNTNTNNEQQSRPNTGGESDINVNSNGLSSSISVGSGSSSSNTIGTNTDKNTGGLAQKIINNVKDKLEVRGIHLP